MSELLDLATVVERDTVRIRTKRNPDGKQYELRGLDELAPFEHEKIVAQHGKVATIAQLARKPTAAEKRELLFALGDILKLLVIDLEPTVLAEMEETQRAKLVSAWALKTSGAAEGEAPASPSTTAGSSRASKRSTAATRKRGSTRPRGS